MTTWLASGCAERYCCADPVAEETVAFTPSGVQSGATIYWYFADKDDVLSRSSMTSWLRLGRNMSRWPPNLCPRVCYGWCTNFNR